MSTRTAYPATEVSGDVLTAANFTKLPGGWIGYAEVNADQGSLTTSSQTLTGLTVTVTVNTSRRIQITGFARFLTATALDDANLNVQDSSTILNGGDVQLTRTTIAYANTITAVVTPSAGSHTYNLTGGLGAGTGPVTMKASATNPAFILVYDLGPA